MLKNTPLPFDERRELYIGETEEETLHFAALHWIHAAQRSIQQRGRFAVALSGGSTPKAIYAALVKRSEIDKIDWSKVWLFWSDERAVPATHPDSNYRMAMESFGKVPIPPSQIFPMQAGTDIERSARRYEEEIRRHLDKHLFDLVMLGLGEDGHTASLFPGTKALAAEEKLVAANYLPEKKIWRMTLTFPCINQSRHIALYALGSAKQAIVPQVLEAAILSPWPASRIGTPESKALWILDSAAAAKIKPIY